MASPLPALRFGRLGLLDLIAMIVVGLVLLMPAASPRVESVYPAREQLDPVALARAQADALMAPDDGVALLRYVDQLDIAEQSDLALRIAGDAAARPGPLQWRALLAVASVHADRLEPQLTYEWTGKALAACDASAATCPSHERLRIELYQTALKKAIDTGIDPRRDPDGFKRALDTAIPMIRVGGPRNKPPK